MGLGSESNSFGVWGLGFRAWGMGLGSESNSCGFWVLGFGFRLGNGLGFRVK